MQTVCTDTQLAPRSYLPGSHHVLTLQNLTDLFAFSFLALSGFHLRHGRPGPLEKSQWKATLVNLPADLLASMPNRFSFHG